VKASETRKLGRAEITVTALGCGTAPLGGLYTPVSIADARETLAAAWDAGIRYFDSAPMYGRGRSEHLLGNMLRETAETVAVSTKVGRLMANDRPGRVLPPELPPNPLDAGWHNGLPFREVFDYSYDGIMRSFDDSQQRTGLARFGLLFVHDIGRVTHGALHDGHWTALTDGGGFRALAALREAGLIAGYGLGVNEAAVIRDAMEAADLDCCLLAGRLTLLDHAAGDTLLPQMQRRGVDLVIGGAFNSGILVPGGADSRKFDYAEAPPEILARAARLEAVCRDFDVPLPAAALQFPLRYAVVKSVVIGAKSAAQLRANVEWFERPLPDDLWRALAEQGLIPAL
jgi:D-threo-aldose 1-dehydrogenase